MSKLTSFLIAIPFFAVSLLAQVPAPSAVLNPASNIPAGLPNSGIAQGSIFVVYGKNLGPAALAQASLPLPTTEGLVGTSIQVTVGGTTVNAPVVYTLATQVAGVLPSNTPLGNGTLKVVYNGQSGSTPITVVKTNFGASTVNQSGTGPAVVTRPDYSVITVTNSAKPGETLVLWGTGLGPINGSDTVAPSGGDLGTNIQVQVSGQNANVSYRGRSGFPGLDQINFVVPQNVSGCYVSLAVQTGTAVSNFTTLPVAANGGACSDSNGLPISSLPTSSGAVRIGYVQIDRSTYTTAAIGTIPASTTTTTSGSASFYKLTTSQLTQSGSLTGQPSLGGCTVSFSSGASSGSPFALTQLNAGPSISVTGPTPFTMAQVSGQVGTYSADSLLLANGTYQASNGTGGSDVGPFTVPLSLANQLTWTNQASAANVDRTQPFTVSWSGGDPSSYVGISGTSVAINNGVSVGGVFICVAPVSAGQFTIPSSVLLAIPASRVMSVGGSNVPTGIMLVSSYSNPKPFTASGLDYGYAGVGSTTAIPVNFK